MHNRDEEDDIFEQDTEEWMEKKRAERIRELNTELAEVWTALRFAAGFISATQHFSGKHPEDVLKWIIAASKIGQDTP